MKLNKRLVIIVNISMIEVETTAMNTMQQHSQEMQEYHIPAPGGGGGLSIYTGGGVPRHIQKGGS